MNEVREGFLCPICMADLGDDIQLTVHFDEKHSREDPAIVQNFKELLTKAKKKITSDQHPSNSSVLTEPTEFDYKQEFFGLEPSMYHPVSGIHYDIEHANEPEIIDKFEQFRKDRRDRVDPRAKDINKLGKSYHPSSYEL